MAFDPRENLLSGATRKGKNYPPEPFTDDEMERLYLAMKQSHRTGLGRRNIAALKLMWRGGLRAAEVLSLTANDINWTTGNITVKRGKGDKRRVTRVDEKSLADLMAWERIRPADSETFICKPDGKPMASSALRQMLSRAGERAGITHPVRPHGLRHRFAIELAREGVPIAYISRLLGHENIATTQAYFATLTIEDALDAITERNLTL
jgi:integrase